MSDDFCIDENAAMAYITTHRENTIDRVPLPPRSTSESRRSVAGDPFDEQLIGPSSGVWGRDPGDYGRIAYFITDGGTTAPPPDGNVRHAKVLVRNSPPSMPTDQGRHRPSRQRVTSADDLVTYLHARVALNAVTTFGAPA